MFEMLAVLHLHEVQPRASEANLLRSSHRCSGIAEHGPGAMV